MHVLDREGGNMRKNDGRDRFFFFFLHARRSSFEELQCHLKCFPDNVIERPIFKSTTHYNVKLSRVFFPFLGYKGPDCKTIFFFISKMETFVSKF